MDQFAGSDLAYANQTSLRPLALAVLLVLGGAMFLLPRRYAAAPMVLMATLVSPAQRLVIAGLDFDMLRLMTLIGWARILVQQETRGFRFCALDQVLIAWAVSGTIAYTALHGTTSALINRLGFAFDAIGMYFLFRCLLGTWSDVWRLVQVLLWASIPVAGLFLFEWLTARNAFAIWGGVPIHTIVRDGRLRCQGPFPHSILAGCFWAALLPLIGAAWWLHPERRGLIGVSIAACVMIVICSASSTPIGALAIVIVGAVMYRFRQWLPWILWSMPVVLFALHMMMKKPVWHLLARISFTSGSTGWHRYKLIDATINHFSEWAFLGVTSTAEWGRGLQDITNQFVLEAVRGGFVTLALFVATIVIAFRTLSEIMRRAEHLPPYRVFAWAIGVAVAVHCVSFIAVSYFGQMMMLWYLTLAMVAGLSQASLPRPRTAATRPVRPAQPSTMPGGMVTLVPRVQHRIP